MHQLSVEEEPAAKIAILTKEDHESHEVEAGVVLRQGNEHAQVHEARRPQLIVDDPTLQESPNASSAFETGVMCSVWLQ